jgi:hypothetical protein
MKSFFSSEPFTSALLARFTSVTLAGQEICFSELETGV